MAGALPASLASSGDPPLPERQRAQFGM